MPSYDRSIFTRAMDELRAQAERISDAIGALERYLERPVNQAPAPDRTARARTIPHTARKPVAPAKSTPPPAKSVPTGRAVRGGDAMDRVFAAIVGRPRTMDQVVSVTKMPKGTVYGNIVRLTLAKKITSYMDGRKLVYTPANAKKGDVGKTVWSGTKERAGEAPTLSSVRPAV